MSEIVNGLDAEPPADGDDPSPRDGDAAKNGGDPAPTPKKAPQLHRPSYYAESFHEHFFPHPYDEAVDSSASTPPPRKKLSVAQRYAVSMARRPKTHLSIAFAIAVVLSVLGLQFGNFAISVDNAGWWSRGTLISNRATQEMLVNMNREDLFYDDTGEVWEELTTVIQPNWQGTRDDEEEKAAEEVDDETLQDVCSGKWYGSADMVRSREKNLVSIWKTADAEDSNPQRSMLEVDAMYDLCVAEQNTLAALEADDSCYKCPAPNGNEAEVDGKCIQPYSLVLMARLYLAGNDISQLHTLSETISCDALRSAWTPSVQKHFTMTLGICTDWSIRMASGGGNNVTLPGTDIAVTNPCPFPIRFTPTVVDGLFPSSDPPIVRYSSSYYATKKGKDTVEGMFEASQDKEYDRSDGDPMSGVYDTTDEDFSALYSDAIVGRDMALAVGSAGVTVIAMLIHTRSPFLTLMGLFQIILSFPLAYFFYYFVAGLVFFPFLNFIGIFVVFALGADDVFVAVDKWKNARHELPHGSTEQVAALALPDAAYAMLLTSLTTAVAFFGTAICPVGPIVCFAVFCGLLIVFDYLMNIFLVFPALCLYDKWLLAGSKNCCVSFNSCRRQETDAGSDAAETDTTVDDKCVAADVERSIPVGGTLHSASEEDGANSAAKGSHSNPDDEDSARGGLLEAEHQTLIHRILDGYYKILHKFRWAVLAVVTAAFVACTVFAAQLTLPTSSDVAILPESNEYQMHWEWSQELLPVELAKEEGSSAMITWGVTPADTGDHLNPDSWTTLVLDETFDPRTQEAQSYLLSFCNRLFGEFGKVKEDYTCPMNLFDEWLQEQSTSDMPTDAYANCGGASSAPIASDVFDQCIISWSKLVNNTSVLQSEGRVRTLTLRTKSNVTYDAPFNELKDEWTTYETWMEKERDAAPSGVDKAFNSDITYWWLDTNEQMLRTAYGAAGIALVCAAIVIFVSSRSFVLTLFATVSIAYVLLATTACLVGLGWELGFLESILFAIVIGISCDFVIHVGHAYTMYSGSVVRQYRSHFALTHMGPSILAAAFTTFMAAVVMIFTEITFFTKFAVILFMTIVHSTIGCFVVFLVLCDCFGPAEPMKGYDTIKARLCSKGDKVDQ